MPTVIPVKFRYASRDLWFDPRDTEAIEGDHVICETERGLEIGLATEDTCDISYNDYKRTAGDAPLRPVVRLATDEDLARAEELAARGDEAMPVFRRLAKEGGLDMKPVGVEYLFDGAKVVCYFSADERVDFRQLVRDLSRELHSRIDMRQIGVREEAALVGGFGHCGQELCCARFGRQFEPVSIRMAKEQDLPLNSTKISGACGRLMCCLRYEFEAYRDFKQRAPKRNAVIDTPLGKAKIVEYDTPKEELALRIENGKVVRVRLAEMEASEAAVRKSEELKCPCRPDTVTREALEKLSSPDVQMALAELDRANGLLEEETFSPDDLFVNAKPRRRSRRGDGPGSRGEAAGGASGAGTEATGSGAGAGSGSGSGEAPAGRRRRRRKGGQAQAAEAAGTGSAPQAGRLAAEGGEATSSRRRRRHHSAEGADAAGQAAAGKGPEGQQESRRRRRPGDRGGGGAQQAQQPSRPKHAAPSDTASQAQRGAAAASGEGAAPKKRRRRRHRSGGTNGTSASAE